MNRIIDWSSSSEDEEQHEHQRQRVFRVHRNPFSEYDDIDFVMRFRVSKQCVEQLLDLFGCHLEPKTNRNKPVSALNQILITLRFYATGDFQICLGDMFNISKSTVCRIVRKVTHHIASMRSNFIALPTDRTDIMRVQHEFHSLARFPKVLAAIDCTHIRIQSPGGEDAEVYRNRKGWFSINTQCVCDSRLKFFDIVARWPGSAHDANIFDDSLLRARFENNEYPNCFLLGDGGYPCRNYLLTPVLNPNTPPQIAYNNSQIKTRNVIERAFGVWKRRFPCLSIGMRVDIRTITAVIVATAVLHNIAIEMREEEPPNDPAVLIPSTPNFELQAPPENITDATRNQLIDSFFNR